MTVSLRGHAAIEEARLLSERRGLPKVLFLISAQNLSSSINEISNIVQLIGLSILIRFHYRPRYDAYFELFRQLLISMQVIVPLPAEGEELGIFGHPVREMILGEDRELGTL